MELLRNEKVRFSYQKSKGVYDLSKLVSLLENSDDELCKEAANAIHQMAEDLAKYRDHFITMKGEHGRAIDAYHYENEKLKTRYHSDKKKIDKLEYQLEMAKSRQKKVEYCWHRDLEKRNSGLSALRQAGFTFQELAEIFDVSVPRASAIYERCLRTRQIDESIQEKIDSGALDGFGIDELEISVRSYNALNNAGIKTIKQVVHMADGELLNIYALGKVCLSEIRDAINIYIKRNIK